MDTENDTNRLSTLISFHRHQQSWDTENVYLIGVNYVRCSLWALKANGNGKVNCTQYYSVSIQKYFLSIYPSNSNSKIWFQKPNLRLHFVKPVRGFQVFWFFVYVPIVIQLELIEYGFNSTLNSWRVSFNFVRISCYQQSSS